MEVINHFKMEILPIEGTYYSKTYESKVLTNSAKPAGTAILGLYSNNPLSRSLFHKLDYDEIWHFYAGDPIKLILLFPDSKVEEVILGSDFKSGEKIQYVVPAGVWQAGEIVSGGDWALFGCTMAPGFHGEIFEGGHFKELINKYPSARNFLERLCVSENEEIRLPKDYKD